MKAIRLVAVLMLLALPAFAGAKKEWGSSPQSYFMTKAERQQWTAIKSDAEAEEFIKRFVASRGPGFADEVTKRAAAADKYLSFATTPGSRTLRGKIIILLGPPTSFNVTEHAMKGGFSSTASAAMNSASDQGPSVADMRQAADRSGMGGKMLRAYNFVYAANALPKEVGTDLNVTVELDPTRESESIPDQKAAAAVEQALELAAKASIKE